MLEFAGISTGTGERIACSACGRTRAVEFRPSSSIIAEVGAAAGSGCVNVSLGGAEPLAHPEIPRIVAECVGLGVRRLRLITDGIALGMGDNAVGSLDAGVRHVRVIALGDEATHDRLADAPGALAAARAGVTAFCDAAEQRSATICVSGLVPVCAHNLHACSGAIVELARMGAGEVVLKLDGSLPGEEAIPYVLAACQTGTVNGVWVAVEGLAPEELGEAGLYATPLYDTGTP